MNARLAIIYWHRFSGPNPAPQSVNHIQNRRTCQRRAYIDKKGFAVCELALMPPKSVKGQFPCRDSSALIHDFQVKLPRWHISSLSPSLSMTGEALANSMVHFWKLYMRRVDPVMSLACRSAFECQRKGARSQVPSFCSSNPSLKAHQQIARRPGTSPPSAGCLVQLGMFKQHCSSALNLYFKVLVPGHLSV